MSDTFSARLDELERQLEEFASELTRLRQEAATESQPLVDHASTTTTEAAPAVVSTPAVASTPATRPTAPTEFDETLELARSLFAQGAQRRALADLDGDRLRALRREDVEALSVVLAVARKLTAETPSKFEARRANLAYSAEQNIRFLARKHGSGDEAEAFRPMGAEAVDPKPTPAQPPTPQPSTTEPLAGSATSRPTLGWPQLDVSDLLGARALALAGGVVTLLGSCSSSSSP